jgi:hypothetical protein
LVSTRIIILAVIVPVLAVLFIFILTRWARSASVGFLSHLKCEKCGTEFDYAWIPGVSFTSVRLGSSRIFRCPVCRKFSVFDIWDTRVDRRTHHCDIRVGPS